MGPQRSSTKKKGGGLSCLGIQRAVQGQLESLIKACAHSGDVAGAEHILNKMDQRGEEPNLDDYNCIIHACAQAGDVVRAQAYLRRMVQKGINPNTITYNTVINACAAQGDVAEAEMWLLHMKWRNFQPTEVTYGTICKALARVGNVERIEEIMGSLEQDGLALNEYFYASLISACGAADPPNIQRAEKVPFQMVARGLRPKSVKRALDRVIGHTRTQQILQELEGGGRPTGGEKPAAGRTRTTSSTSSKSTTASLCLDYNSEPPAAPEGSLVQLAGTRRDRVASAARPGGDQGKGYAPSTPTSDAYKQQGYGYVPSTCATGGFLQQGLNPNVFCNPPTVWWMPSMYTGQQH